ncbi:hypothetical protein [Stygiolobus caldivivus]|uniref:hypothetical protein n=1 Tax=Stygiolobus caldivivus TaxID=2824673 RepID=UPI00215EEDAE|nr:hypothetical protein [Stygiolobus caldivivus]
MGEVYSLSVEQVDLENGIIKLMKNSATKRAYISFLHRYSRVYLYIYDSCSRP